MNCFFVVVHFDLDIGAWYIFLLEFAADGGASTLDPIATREATHSFSDHPVFQAFIRHLYKSMSCPLIVKS